MIRDSLSFSQSLLRRKFDKDLSQSAVIDPGERIHLELAEQLHAEVSLIDSQFQRSLTLIARHEERIFKELDLASLNPPQHQNADHTSAVTRVKSKLNHSDFHPMAHKGVESFKDGIKSADDQLQKLTESIRKEKKEREATWEVMVDKIAEQVLSLEGAVSKAAEAATVRERAIDEQLVGIEQDFKHMQQSSTARMKGDHDIIAKLLAKCMQNLKDVATNVKRYY